MTPGRSAWPCEQRIQAVVTVAGVNFKRLMREGFSGGFPIETTRGRRQATHPRSPPCRATCR